MFKLNPIKALALAFIVGVSSAPAIAQEEVPTFYDGSWPDANGDYPIRREYQQLWQVVDRDPDGLNCRGFLPPSESSEEVVTTFTEGDVITAYPRSRGIYEIIDDEEGQPWLMVDLADEAGSCWIRANSEYIVPVNRR